ncbi:MAG: hypothetical protein R3C20_11405 [Planctomycetaceae bacterium]
MNAAEGQFTMDSQNSFEIAKRSGPPQKSAAFVCLNRFAVEFAKFFMCLFSMTAINGRNERVDELPGLS